MSVDPEMMNPYGADPGDPPHDDVPPAESPEDYWVVPEWHRAGPGGISSPGHGGGPGATVHKLDEVRAKGSDTVEAFIARAKANGGEGAFDPDFLADVLAMREAFEGRFLLLRDRLKAERIIPVTAWDKALKKVERAAAPDTTAVDIMVGFVSDADLFVTPSRATVYVDIEVRGARQTWPVKSEETQRWLRHMYHAQTGSAPHSTAVGDAVAMLDAKGWASAVEREVFVRVGGHDRSIYVDIGDDTWRAIEIDAADWRIVDQPPVRFQRSAGMLPLPMPERGGDMSELWNLVNLTIEEDRSLMTAWLCAAFHPEADMQYPVLVPHGEQGAAKSSVTRIVRRLVDPNKAPLRRPPKGSRADQDLMISANNSRMIVFDNLSHISDDMSDMLCTLATGGGFSARKLHSDTSEILICAKRPVVLNGIQNVVKRGDLAERSISLQLAPIPANRRRPECEIDAEFVAAAPRILGALFDRVARGLRRRSAVKLPELPRMADFTVWAVACEPESEAGKFIAAYARNSFIRASGVLADDPVVMALISLVSRLGPIRSTAGDLLAALSREAPDAARDRESWPQSPQKLSGVLRLLAPALREGAGLSVSQVEKCGHDNKPKWIIARAAEPTRRREPGEDEDALAEYDN